MKGKRRNPYYTATKKERELIAEEGCVFSCYLKDYILLPEKALARELNIPRKRIRVHVKNLIKEGFIRGKQGKRN